MFFFVQFSIIIVKIAKTLTTLNSASQELNICQIAFKCNDQMVSNSCFGAWCSNTTFTMLLFFTYSFNRILIECVFIKFMILKLFWVKHFATASATSHVVCNCLELVTTLLTVDVYTFLTCSFWKFSFFRKISRNWMDGI